MDSLVKKDIMGIYGQMINTYRKMPGMEDAPTNDTFHDDSTHLHPLKLQKEYKYAKMFSAIQQNRSGR